MRTRDKKVKGNEMDIDAIVERNANGKKEYIRIEARGILCLVWRDGMD